jgi:hypothetical protein
VALTNNGWDVRVYTKYARDDFMGHFTVSRDGIEIRGSIMFEGDTYRTYWPYADGRMVAGPSRDHRKGWDEVIIEELKWRHAGGSYDNGMY